MTIPTPPSKQPIPAHARKVFTGVIFDVYQWEQEMFDGSIEIFEKLKRPDTVIIFPVLEDGRILLTKQEQPGKEKFWGATGGRVEPGEDILAAAQRELREESGYEAGEFEFWKAEQPVGKIDWFVYIFVARNLRKVGAVHLHPGEKIELAPVSFAEFLQIATKPNFYEQEIYKDVIMAMYDEQKRAELQYKLRAV